MLGYEIDWAVTAQMTTAVAAIIALFLGPLLGFEVSRRLAVSQSRQSWLDGVRSDLAQLIALHEDQVSAIEEARQIREMGLRRQFPSDQSGDYKHESGMLLHRVRMRLDLSDAKQLNLLAKLTAFVTCHEPDHDDYNPNPVLDAFEAVRDTVLRDIKSARL
jgi:hypothetical protein